MDAMNTPEHHSTPHYPVGVGAIADGIFGSVHGNHLPKIIGNPPFHHNVFSINESLLINQNTTLEKCLAMNDTESIAALETGASFHEFEHILAIDVRLGVVVKERMLWPRGKVGNHAC